MLVSADELIKAIAETFAAMSTPNTVACAGSVLRELERVIGESLRDFEDVALRACSMLTAIRGALVHDKITQVLTFMAILQL